MRIVVFGASSRAGLYIVKEALEREHRVAAFTQRPEGFPLGHPKLEAVGGDILDTAAVARAVQGAHGVICCPEERGGKAAVIPDAGLENLVRGMEAAACRRLIYISSADEARRGIKLLSRIGLNRLYGSRGSASAKADLGRLRRSGLDWMLVRTPSLREGAGSGRLKAECDGLPGRFVFLGELAAFIVEELEKGRYLKRVLTVSSV